MKSSLACLSLILAGLIFTNSLVRADFILVDITNSTNGTVGSPGDGDYLTVGFKFTLAQQSIVTSLGVWDYQGNGLALSHDVGLWNSDGSSLLASATVPAGTGGSVVVSSDTGTYAGSSWRFTSLGTPLTLAAGTYILGAEYFRNGGTYDDYIFGPSSIQMAAGSTFVGRRLGSAYSTSGLQFPNFEFSGNGYFGPNLQLSSVPEPATLVLWPVLGMVAVTFRKSRRS